MRQKLRLKNNVDTKSRDGKEKFCNLIAERQCMKRIISLLLCLTMIFGSVPTVIAAPVIDTVESADVTVMPDTNDEDAVLASTGAVLPDGVEAYDSTYGNLIYFDDFGDGCSDYFNTAVVGDSAEVSSKQLAYVTEGNWGSNIVDNPDGEGKVQKLTANTSKYGGSYTGYTFGFKNVSIAPSDITVAWDLYFPEEQTESFKYDVGNGWKSVSGVDYTGSGSWQTIYIPVDGISDFSANGNIQLVCSVAQETTYYIDNIRVYAKSIPVSYAEKPAAIDDTLGSLIYFDNCKSEDFVGSDKITVHGVGDVSAMNGYYAKNLYRDESVGMLSPGAVVKTKNGTFAQSGYNGTLTMVADVYSPAEYKYYQIADMQYTSSYWPWGGWYAGPGLSTNGAYKTLTLKVDTAGKTISGFGFKKSSNSGIPYARSVAVYYMPANYVKLTEGDSTKLIDLGTETTFIVKSPESTAYNAWQDASGRIYLEGDKVASGTALTAAVCSFEPVNDTYGTLVWLDDFNTEGSQKNATYVNTDWNIALSSPNLVFNKFGTEGDRRYLQVQSYWYGGYKLTANDNTGVPGNYTLVVDYKWPSDTSINSEVTSDKAWMSFNEATLGGSGYCYPAKPTLNTWGTMAYTFAVDSGSTFTDAMFRGGTTNQNVYYFIDEIKLYFLPLNYVKLTEGTKIKLVDLQSSNEYTLPAPNNTTYNAWKDADGKYYLAGDKVNAGTALTAVTVAYAEKPALYNETYGNLVYFDNFSGNTGFVNTGDFIIDGVGTTSAIIDDIRVKSGVSVLAGTQTESVMGGIVVTAKDGTSYKYTDGTVMNGNLTLLFDVYNDVNGSRKFYDVADVTGSDATNWRPWITDWSSTSVAAKSWGTLKITESTQNTRFGRLNSNGNAASFFFSNVAIYFNPANKLILVDGENKSYADLNSITEFTFPAISTTGKNAWKDEAGNAYIPGEKLPVADCKDKTYTASTVVFDEISKLEATATEITSDRGTVTVKPVVRYTNGIYETDFSDVAYVADKVNATITRNNDGSITVKGQINGDITITAIIPEEIKEKLETPADTWTLTINISGQPERIVSSTFKVMMFGNSIRAHEAAPNMGWYGETRGMAASSIDKDYAHRFLYYMNEKFGEGSAELVSCFTPDYFESEATSCKEYNPADFEGYIESFKSQIIEKQPDIITVQLGENGSGATSEIYAKVMTQLIKGIQSAAPDAIVVMSTPFWSADDSPLVVGTYATAKECGIEVAPVNTLGQGPWDGSNLNMAFQAPWITSATTNGVKAHPGDEGMDKIAKMFFEKVNVSLSEKELEYTLVPQSVEITNSSLEITEQEGILELTAKVLPDGASQDVIWSLVSDKAYNYATINEDGVLTAINNGTVTVRATSRFKSTVYDEADVLITGQTDPFTVTYDGNAADATVPAPNEMAKKGFDLTNVNEFATRPTYKFLGWSLTPDGEVVKSLDTTETDVTVYAQWELADNWDFERAGYLEGFDSEFGFHQKVAEGVYSVTATGTTEQNAVKIISPELNLSSYDYYMLVINMKNDNKASDTVAKISVVTDRKTYDFEKAVTSTNFTEYRFDLSEVSGTITGFEIKPTNIDCEIQIEEIKFLKNGKADYAEKPALYNEAKGILVYFYNGNASDTYSDINANLVGHSEKSVADGYYVTDIMDYAAIGLNEGSTYAIGLDTGDTAVNFAYPDGRDYAGNLTFYVDIHNAHTSNLSFFNVARTKPDWEVWQSCFQTNWGKKTATAGEWTIINQTYYADLSFVGFARTSLSNNAKLNFKRAYAYFMPDNFVKLNDGGELKIIDVNGLSTFTFPESENGSFDGWKYGSDTEYIALESVDVSEVIGKTFTSCDVNAGKITYVGAGNDYVEITEGSVQYEFKTDNYPEWDMSIDGTQRECIGWSTTENSDTTETNFTVTQFGLTLYPVWQKTADAVDYEITASGETRIEIDNVDRTYAFTAGFSTEVPDATVNWSVSDETVAKINENGVLTPLKNGEITVTATANYYPRKSATVDVSIDYKEGFEPVNVTFEGDVKELPEAFTVIPGKKVDLSNYLNMKSAQDGKRFNGWILNGNSSEILTGEVTAVTDTDMVFTALVNYDFNFAVPQRDSRYYNHGTIEVVDEMLKCTANGGESDTYIAITGLSIPASNFKAIEYYVDVNYKVLEEPKTFTAGQNVGEFYFVVNGYSGPYDGKVESITEDGKYAVIRYDLSSVTSWKDTVTQIRNDFVGGTNYCSYGVRYIRLVEKEQISEKNVTITDITTPVTGYAPDTTASMSESFAKIDSVSWSCGENDSFLASGKYNQNTAYTVTVKLSSKNETMIMNKALTATINGKTADVVICDDGTAAISYTFTPTDAFLAFNADITGNSVIQTAGRAYQYKFNVSNEDVPDATATWSIDNTDLGTITAESGRLIARKNGTVKITAVSNYNPSVSVTFDVEFKNINEVYHKISFNAGTTDTVTGMPAEMTVLRGVVSVPEAAPSRDGYVFLGWSESENSSELAETLIVYEDMTLYAVWGKGILWEFNGTTEGFKDANGASQLITSEQHLIVKTTSGEDVRLATPAIDVDPNKYKKVIIKFAVDTMSLTDVFYSADNSSIDGSRRKTINHTKAGLDNWQTLTFDFSEVSGWNRATKITKLWIDIFQSKNTTAYIDYIAILLEESGNSGSSTEGPTDSAFSASSSSTTVEKKPASAPETVTQPGEVFPAGDENPEDVGSVKLELSKEGTSLFNFDKAYHNNMFDSVTSLENGFETESVLSYRLFSKNSSAVKTAEMIINSVDIDADEKNYIIVRARHFGLEKPNLRIYFTTTGESEYSKFRSVRQVLTNDYTTLVYDMSKNKYWDGKITSLKFTAENNYEGTIDFDWIMVTDKIPEDTEQFNEAKDIFETVVSDAITFEDVSKRAWYYSEVNQSYQKGFVKGKSEQEYAPDSSVTVAEALTIAVRLNSIYYGKDIPEISTEGNWYDEFVNAAIKAKIIGKAQFARYDVPATRREIAMIMANALPSEYLEAINVFNSIPDVISGSKGYSQIIMLYKAGVLIGSDAQYNFNPETEISRAELAAIVNRLAIPGARKRVYTEDERISDRLVFEGSRLGACSLWSCEKGSLSVDKDGYAWATSTGTDPIALLHTVTGRFDGRDVVRIKLGVKWDENEVELTPHIYYATSSANSFAGNRVFKGVIGEKDENGVAEVVFDVKTQSAFADTITQLRFDPFEVKGKSFAITYIIIE